MKLTICQFSKLFLLWTIFFHNNHKQQQQQQQSPPYQHHYNHQQQQQRQRQHYSLGFAAEAAYIDANFNVIANANANTDVITPNTLNTMLKIKEVNIKEEEEPLLYEKLHEELLLFSLSMKKLIHDGINEMKLLNNCYQFITKYHFVMDENKRNDNKSVISALNNITQCLNNIKQINKINRKIDEFIQKNLKLFVNKFIKIKYLNENKRNMQQLLQYNITALSTLLLPTILYNNLTIMAESLPTKSISKKQKATIPAISITTTTTRTTTPIPIPQNFKEFHSKYENDATIPTYRHTNLKSNSNGNSDTNKGHLRYKKSVTYSNATSTTPKNLMSRTASTTTQVTYFYQRIIILLPPSTFLNGLPVERGFYKFVEFFQMNLTNILVDFLPDDGLNTFIKLLDDSYYTTVVKVLNSHLNKATIKLNNKPNNFNEQSYENKYTNHIANGISSNNNNNNNNDNNDDDGDDGDVSNDETERNKINERVKNVKKSFNEKLNSQRSQTQTYHENHQYEHPSEENQGTDENHYTNIGYCNLETELARNFNKTVLIWPCPHMQEPGNFLPSHEAVSFAVKSVVNKMNWTQINIYVGDENWALPMAIAANLHIPYKIMLRPDGLMAFDGHFKDAIGNAIIVTAPMNHRSTLQALTKWQSLLYTKVLLIDIIAASFNAENHFYKHLTHLPYKATIIQNLLLLTVLSDNYRHFLNIAVGNDHHGIELMQNVHHIKRWRTNKPSKAYDWPMYLDDNILQKLKNNATISNNSNGSSSNSSKNGSHSGHVKSKLRNGKFLTVANAKHRWSDCFVLIKNRTAVGEGSLCDNWKFIREKCWYQLHNLSQDITIKQIYDELYLLFIQQSNSCMALEMSSSSSSSSSSSTSFHSIYSNWQKQQQLIEYLEEYMEFFNFYDFLMANILLNQEQQQQQQQPQQQQPQPQFKQSMNITKTIPNYDFLVLDITFNYTDVNDIDDDDDVKMDSQESLVMNKRFKWRPILILEQHEINLSTYITHSIQPAYNDWLLVASVQVLWHCTTICWIIIGICVAILILIVAASIAVGIALRNYFLRKRLSKGPNKIVLSANDFVFPVDSRRVDEGIEAMLCCWLQQLQEFGGPEIDKPDLLKGSIGSLRNLGFIIPGMNSSSNAGVGKTTGSAVDGNNQRESNKLARHNPALLDMRARYNGDLVQLKEVSLNSSNELKAKAMDLLVVAHGLRHENVNPFIGWLADPNRTALVFDYCSRGSLQDVLIMDEIKLDWSFRLSLLTDLVRGMRYLHNSPLRVHGTLTSRNCVVDARWVLKITDYGLPLFYEAQGLIPPQRSAKELLWTAPELLRAMKIHQTSVEHHNQHQHEQQEEHHNGGSLQYHGKLMGTQSGDVYSFGIIMQEVVVRGEPYCMLSLSAEEIIMKIKKPPPLIRPSVSKGAAPPEAINIMRQCWAEQPDMRPDFNSVYERFKLLNHGRKVNFVDTMFQMLEKYSNNLEELIRERTEQLDIERKKTEQLLNRMLPSSVAEKLKLGLAVEPEEFSDVTIYFSDIVGFTTIAAHCTPVQVVDLLNDLYTIFDATINAYNVYKVETIGDAYMVVSGLPVRTPDHAEQIATMALDLLHQSGRFHVKHLPGVPVQLRIGLHTGPCCAGVVGLTMPRYCLFGDTVNTASRMESTGSSWRIHLSQETRDRLVAHGGYTIEPRGPINIKGKGTMNTFWLLGKKGFDKPLPNPPPIGESYGLDELLLHNTVTLKSQTNKPRSNQTSSLTGDAVEVKVEITPALTSTDTSSGNLQNSYSLDSNSTNTISPNVNLCPDFPSKTSSCSSPQSQKVSDSTTSAKVAENLLNPSMNFTRLPNSTGGSSSRLYRKLEEMMDLSLPYNHYKCLSPSESNLTQFYDGKYIYSSYSSGSNRINAGNILSSTTMSSFVGGLHSFRRFEKPPGSTRLLRRQFSLDREDHHHHAMRRELQRQFVAQVPLQNPLKISHTLALNQSVKSTGLDVPTYKESSRSPKIPIARIHKQNSTSIAQDLEKIEEIPLSPVPSQQHSSLDSNINKSPPSMIESMAGTQAFPKLTKRIVSCERPIAIATSTPKSTPNMTEQETCVTVCLLSAPTSPASSRSLNGLSYDTKLNPTTLTLTTVTTTATKIDATTAAIYSTQIGVERQENVQQQQIDLTKPELTLNVTALLSR